MSSLTSEHGMVGCTIPDAALDTFGGALIVGLWGSRLWFEKKDTGTSISYRSAWYSVGLFVGQLGHLPQPGYPATSCYPLHVALSTPLPFSLPLLSCSLLPGLQQSALYCSNTTLLTLTKKLDSGRDSSLVVACPSFWLL